MAAQKSDGMMYAPEAEVLDNRDIRLVAAAAIPNERGPLGSFVTSEATR